MIVIWDYECPECGKVEERFVKSEDQDEQFCEDHPEIKMNRLPASITGWVEFEGRTHQQLKKRSEEHTERMLDKQNDLELNERQTQTNRDWYNKTRNKNTKKGVVQEKSNMWKGWADKPSVEKLSRK